MWGYTSMMLCGYTFIMLRSAQKAPSSSQDVVENNRRKDDSTFELVAGLSDQSDEAFKVLARRLTAKFAEVERRHPSLKFCTVAASPGAAVMNGLPRGMGGIASNVARI